MNITQHLRQAKTNFVGEVAQCLVNDLIACHHAHNIRFGAELPEGWTYGPIHMTDGVWTVLIYQSSGVDVMPGQQGAFVLAFSFLAVDRIEMTMRLANRSRNDERIFTSDEDARSLAGWACDYWDALLARSKDHQPLSTNRRYFPKA